MYSIYSQIEASHFSARRLKVKKTSELLEAEAAVTSHCDGCYSTVASGLWRLVTKSLGTVLESYCCVFSFSLSHTYLCLYSILAKRKKWLPGFEWHAYP